MVASIQLVAKVLYDLSSQENICQGRLFAKCFKISSSQNPVGNYSLKNIHGTSDTHRDSQPACYTI